MNIVGFIFARGGSKGLPRKNVLSLAGKPLIAWSIEQAKAVHRIRRILVSTDSYEISSISKKFGAEVPFMRPDELSTDESPEWLAWRHALTYLRETEGALPDVMISIPATSPLRSIQDLENCLDEYLKGGSDVVISTTDAHRNPFFNMVRKNLDGTVSLLISPREGPHFRRQDAPAVYDMTTVAYAVNPAFVLANDSLFEGRIRAIHVPKERALDIDCLLDFEIAEFLMKKSHVSS
jgi:CMP-N-acetylneuraminic acid synthetase